MTNITITHKKYQIPAYVAGSKNNRAGIILIHEVWGLNKNIRSLADRLAAQGYLVLAPDLISQTGITEKIDQSILAEAANPATRDEAQKKMRAIMAPIRSEEFGMETVEGLKICFNYLKQEYDLKKIAVMGFCFGGTYSYSLAVNEPAIAAALPFYGHAPEKDEELARISCPVLAFYGEKDTALVQDLPRLQNSMKKLKKDFRFKVYPNTGHAFMNDTNPTTYNKEAADDAWKEALQFLKAHL
ncbi:MAG: dienelactone hydrolase family protein [Candidatus Methanoperedens sp.]